MGTPRLPGGAHPAGAAALGDEDHRGRPPSIEPEGDLGAVSACVPAALDGNAAAAELCGRLLGERAPAVDDDVDTAAPGGTWGRVATASMAEREVAHAGLVTPPSTPPPCSRLHRPTCRISTLPSCRGGAGAIGRPQAPTGEGPDPRGVGAFEARTRVSGGAERCLRPSRGSG